MCELVLEQGEAALLLTTYLLNRSCTSLLTQLHTRGKLSVVSISVNSPLTGQTTDRVGSVVPCAQLFPTELKEHPADEYVWEGMRNHRIRNYRICTRHSDILSRYQLRLGNEPDHTGNLPWREGSNALHLFTHCLEYGASDQQLFILGMESAESESMMEKLLMILLSSITASSPLRIASAKAIMNSLGRVVTRHTNEPLSGRPR